MSLLCLSDSTIAPVITKAPALTTPEDKSEYGSFNCLDHMGMHFTQDDLLVCKHSAIKLVDLHPLLF